MAKVKNPIQSKFNLGSSNVLACVHLRKVHSNIFITVTDLDYKVIICKTSGSSGILNLKRKKRAPYAIEAIAKTLNPYFKSYNIRRVYIILKMRIRAHLYILLRELAFYGIEVVGIKSRRKVSFTAVKGKKIRRV